MILSDSPSVIPSSSLPTSSAPITAIIKGTHDQMLEYFTALSQGSIGVGFNNSTSSEESTFNLNITKGMSTDSITVHDHANCKDNTQNEDIIGVTHADVTRNIDQYFDNIPVTVDIKSNKINQQNEAIHFVNGLKNTDNVNICIRVDLGFQ